MNLGGTVEGLWLDAGWHRVVTGDVEFSYSAKGTLFLKQLLASVEDGRTIDVSFAVTEKAFPFLGRWVMDMGVTDEQRAQMDTDQPETLTPMVGKTLWVLVDWEKGGNGKYYRRVTRHQPDGPRPQGGPIHTSCPVVQVSTAPGHASAAPAVGDDDIPF